MMAFPDGRLLSDRNRLAVLALGALLVCAAFVWRGAFSADFWEHAAVVRELAIRPAAPQHPLLAIDAPHAYISPYLLAVGLAARVTNTPAITALALVGLINLALLVLTFRRFLVRLLPNGHAAAPYALLLVVFLWGRRPWMWSGFLHAGMLGYDVAYPSTFAIIATFLAWSLLLDALDGRRNLPYLGIALLVGLCVITHPPTALVLLVGLAVLFVARVSRSPVLQAARLTGAVTAGVLACLAWPYFPVLDLYTHQPREFHVWCSHLYTHVLRRTWPIMLAAPVLLGRLRANRRDPLVLFAAILAGIYATGGVTEAYGLGRTIAFIAIAVQIAVAAALAGLEVQLPARRRWLVPAATVLVLGALFVNAQQPLPRLVKYDRPPWRDAAAILSPVRPGEVVLTESSTGNYVGDYVPAVSGARVVAWRPPIYWVADHEERRAAQKRFFSPVSDDERREILTRYRVHWVVLNRRGALQGEQQERVLALGCAAVQRDSLVLVDVQTPRLVSCAPPGGQVSFNAAEKAATPLPLADAVVEAQANMSSDSPPCTVMRRFGKTITWSSASQANLSLGELATRRRQLKEAYHRSVLLAIGHPAYASNVSGDVLSRTASTPAEIATPSVGSTSLPHSGRITEMRTSGSISYGAA